MSAMLRSQVKNGKNLQYSKQNLENAVIAVQCGESIRQASVKYGIPKSTIGDRISGRFDISKPIVHGRPPAIPNEIEKKIVESVKMAAKMGVGLSRKQILARTHILCKQIKIQTTYDNFKAGKDWWVGVKRRHPEITLRKPKKLSTVRARMLNPSVVDNYFKDLEKVISELGINGNEIWNCDETGLNFEHTPPKIVTERGSTSVVGKTSQKSSNLTIYLWPVSMLRVAQCPLSLLQKVKRVNRCTALKQQTHLLAQSGVSRKRVGLRMTLESSGSTMYF